MSEAKKRAKYTLGYIGPVKFEECWHAAQQLKAA